MGDPTGVTTYKEKIMKFGRLNIIAGGVVIFIAGFGGFALGFTMESHFSQGFYALPFARALMKAGHSHGMPLALYNLIIGVMVDRLALDDKLKKRLSLLAMGTFIMPVGLLLRGLAGGSEALAPVVLVGALCLFSSAGIMIKGALAAKE
jgi:uncharacterized membrane protein